MDAQAHTGFIVWITGMNGSGKSALARHLHTRLSGAGRLAEIVDADDPAQILTRGLGASKDDRDTAVRRVGHVAKMLIRHGAAVICASLSPYREPREALRREARRFVEVFVDCPMEVLQQRDPIYGKAIAGEAKNVPGVDDPYEPPTHAEVTILSNQESVQAAGLRVFQALVDLKYLSPAEFARVSGGQRPKRAARPAATRKAKHAVRAAVARKEPKKVAARTAKARRSPRR
ncbi:MAG TPA: adenylyl-sulfate kinase [Anaeromyxobacteraceae bacterium]|nr:adenylyl-sulfate kinase [Anaeromyxobacteraceae bacterium]